MFHTTRSPLGWSLAALGLLVAPAHAQTFWTPASGGNWFTATNWDNGIPNGTAAWAQFGRGGSGSQTVSVNGTATVGRLTFKPQTGVASYAHTLTGGGIVLDNGGAAALIESENSEANQTINTPLTVAGNNALTVNNVGFLTTGTNDGAITIASLTGTAADVTINSAPTANGLVVINSGTYGGAGSVTEVRGGVLRANEGFGLPADTALRIDGGFWEVTQTTIVTRTLGTSPGGIQLLGSAGFSTTGGPMLIRLNNNAASQVQWGSADFNPTTLRFGRGAIQSESYVFENAIDLNGAARTVALGPGASAQLSGNLVNTAGTPAGLTVRGAPGGRSMLVLSGTNTYDGTTSVQLGAVLRARDGAGLPTASNLELDNGILQYIDQGVFNRPLGSDPGQVRITGTSGFSAWGGAFFVQLGAGPAVWGSAHFDPTVLQFGSPNGNSTVRFMTGIDLNGVTQTTGLTRRISVVDNPTASGDLAVIVGVISNSTGTMGLRVGGTGTLELTAANTYNGQTLVTDDPAVPGTRLRLAGGGSFANSPVVAVGAGRSLEVTGLTGGANYSAAHGRFQVAAGQTLSGSGTVTGNVLVGPGATIRGGSPVGVLNDPTGQLTVNGSLRLAGGPAGLPTLAIDLNGGSAPGANSRVAVTGAGNVWDIDTTGGAAVLRLVNDHGLTAGRSYTLTVGSSAGGFTRNGASVTSYAYGADFGLASGTFPSFADVSLTVDGSNNLVLTFTPVPEPLTVLAAGAAGLGLLRLRRRLAAAVR